MLPSNPDPWRPRRLALGRRDQLAASSFLILVVAAMAVCFQFVIADDLVDIDQAKPATAVYQVNLNDTRWPELANLPSVGPVTGRLIVAHRRQHENFQSAEDLISIRGVGPATVDKISPFALVD